jgi:hypothetical protein
VLAALSTAFPPCAGEVAADKFHVERLMSWLDKAPEAGAHGRE